MFRASGKFPHVAYGFVLKVSAMILSGVFRA